MSISHASEKAVNPPCLMKIAGFLHIKGLGLSFHGDGAEGSSNFNQLLHLRAFDDSNPDPIVLY